MQQLKTEGERAERARSSREAQGLPPTVEDPAVLRRVAAVLRGGARRAS